jgi:SM-20-related protein
VVLPSFLSAAESAAARAEALAMYSGGAFGAAAAAAPADTNARGDEMLWLHGPPAGAPGLASALARLHALRSDLAQLLSLASDAAVTELQLAVYRPGGASYARHRDAFPEDTAPEGRPGQRRVTAVLYANDAAWDCAAQGGALRLHVPPTPLLDDDEQASDAAGGLIPGAAWVDVAPRGGTLALFLSGAVDHEVLPSSEEHRVALTAWFR